MVVAEHFLFQDSATYLRLWLSYKDKADFLRPPFSPAWEERLRNVDLILGEIAQQAHASGVPVVLVEVPNPTQAELVSSRTPHPGVDPDALNQRLQEISSKHGIRFVNVLDGFRRTQDAGRLFYIVDGHLNPEGSAFISRPLVDQLTEGADPVFAGCTADAQVARNGTK